MTKRHRIIYVGPYRIFSALFILIVAVGGFFVPELGLVVVALIFVALIVNAKARRGFCAGVCPNGRALSSVFAKRSGNGKMPAFLASREFRRALCGLMMFCVVSLLARSGGSVAAIGKVFWSIYLVSIAMSIAAGLLFKPRSWCVVCPMGTLQDTLNPVK